MNAKEIMKNLKETYKKGDQVCYVFLNDKRELYCSGEFHNKVSIWANLDGYGIRGNLFDSVCCDIDRNSHRNTDEELETNIELAIERAGEPVEFNSDLKTNGITFYFCN